jgi:hypothetical protein
VKSFARFALGSLLCGSCEKAVMPGLLSFSLPQRQTGQTTGSGLFLANGHPQNSHGEDQMRRCKLAGALLIVTFAAAPLVARTYSEAAFDKLRSLAGAWEGKDEHGMAAKTNFKVLASETAVMETLSPSGMEEMITLYSIDDDGIALVHYCPTNNQPRMRVVPSSEDAKELSFDYQGAGNLKSPSTGHQHHLVLHFEDDNHIMETWTWREQGKETLMVFHFTRKKK